MVNEAKYQITRPVLRKTEYLPCKPIPEDDIFSAPTSTVSVLAYIGAFLVAMLLLVPIWNALAMMTDSIFAHIVGRAVPISLFISSLLVIGAYFLMVRLFFGSPLQDQTRHNLLVLLNIFLGALGIALILQAVPLGNESENAYDKLWLNCEFTPFTRDLATTSLTLQNLRAGPKCKGEQSVEDCTGYQASRPAYILRDLEQTYRCSGFCHHSGNHSAAEDLTVPYPPALFSKADPLAPCDTMVARYIRDFGGEVSMQAKLQGVVLVCVALVLGFLRTVRACIPHRISSPGVS